MARPAAARRGTQRGFTLVELLLGCSVVAVLAGVALPSYRDRLVNSRRADAVAALMQLQVRQESFRALHGLYGADLASLQSPAHSAQGLYAVSMKITGPDGYRASASAVRGGAQAGDGECATLTLSVNDGFAQYLPNLRCWNR